MLDFNAVRSKRITVDELCRDLDINDLQRLTNEMLDGMQAMIATVQDEDVVFVPDDPEAEDTFAEDPDEALLAWTLGHVVVHATASAEEAAYLAVELARGVTPRDGRSRYEVPWRGVTTVAQCRERLEESRRMRLASLEMWPDPPHLDTVFIAPWNKRSYNAVVRFVFGLMHDDAHLGQIKDIVRQARLLSAGQSRAGGEAVLGCTASSSFRQP